jgi:hypothetical protein
VFDVVEDICHPVITKTSNICILIIDIAPTCADSCLNNGTCSIKSNQLQMQW